MAHCVNTMASSCRLLYFHHVRGSVVGPTCGFFQSSSRISDQSPHTFSEIARAFPKSYQKSAFKSAAELDKVFKINKDGELDLSKFNTIGSVDKCVAVKAVDLLGFVATRRKSVLSESALKTLRPEMLKLKHVYNPAAKAFLQTQQTEQKGSVETAKPSPTEKAQKVKASKPGSPKMTAKSTSAETITKVPENLNAVIKKPKDVSERETTKAKRAVSPKKTKKEAEFSEVKDEITKGIVPTKSVPKSAFPSKAEFSREKTKKEIPKVDDVKMSDIPTQKIDFVLTNKRTTKENVVKKTDESVNIAEDLANNERLASTTSNVYAKEELKGRKFSQSVESSLMDSKNAQIYPDVRNPGMDTVQNAQINQHVRNPEMDTVQNTEPNQNVRNPGTDRKNAQEDQSTAAARECDKMKTEQVEKPKVVISDQQALPPQYPPENQRKGVFSFLKSIFRK